MSLGGSTLVTLPRTVTPYRDSVDGTRDHVTYEKLLTWLTLRDCSVCCRYLDLLVFFSLLEMLLSYLLGNNIFLWFLIIRVIIFLLFLFFFSFFISLVVGSPFKWLYFF